ncbi:hypothetical protein ACHAWF_004023 [Thalassiosira exigua]
MTQDIISVYGAFGTQAASQGWKDPRSEAAVAKKRMTLLVMSREHIYRTMKSLEDVIRSPMNACY